MATVSIKRGDEVIEISDITWEQVKELAGVNGHRRQSTEPQPAARPQNVSSPHSDETAAARTSPDYRGFNAALSEKGKRFFDFLRQHPNGVDGTTFAKYLGFDNSKQIGGLTGGGIAKTAKRFGVNLYRLYVSEITFTNGVRERIFKPGQDFAELK